MGSGRFRQWIDAVDHDANGAVVEEMTGLSQLRAAGSNLCRRHCYPALGCIGVTCETEGINQKEGSARLDDA